MRKLAEGTFQKLKEVVCDCKLLIMRSPDGLRNLLIQHKPSVFRGFDWERREKRMLAKCIGKTNQSVNIKSQLVLNLFFLFSALCPKVLELLPFFLLGFTFFQVPYSACVAGLVGKSKLNVAQAKAIKMELITNPKFPRNHALHLNLTHQ